MNAQEKIAKLQAQIVALEEKEAAKEAKKAAEKELSRWAIISGALKNVKTAIEEGETFLKWSPEQGRYNLTGELPTVIISGFVPRPLFMCLVKEHGFTFQNGKFFKA